MKKFTITVEYDPSELKQLYIGQDGASGCSYSDIDTAEKAAEAMLEYFQNYQS